jgi:Flp pilus assembly protein TadD
VGLCPNKSGPSEELAATLQKQGELTLADQAFASAFVAEPTNAQLLWDRARNLRQAGRPEQARKLLR